MYLPLTNIISKIASGKSSDVQGSLRKRLILVLRMVFLQERLIQDKIYGFMHFWFLYGFLVLSVGHFELVLYGLTLFFEHFNMSPFLYENLSFFPTMAQFLYTLSQDVFAFFVVVISVYALYRRIVVQQKRLMPRSKDAETILWFIIVLYITFFLFTSLEICLREYIIYKTHNTWLWFYPISSLFSSILIKYVGFKKILYLNRIFFFLHYITFLGFACYVPRSKHMHLIFAGPNIFFSSVKDESIQKPRVIDFNNDENFGINTVTNFTWKELLNSFACTECGRCNDVCPAHMTNKPLKPKKIINDIKSSLLNNSTQLIKFSKGKEGIIDVDEIWACTTCGACAEVCPVLIDSVPSSIIEMRRHLVLTEANYYPKELNSAFKSLENQNNPWGLGNDKRIDWVGDLNVPLINNENKDKIDYLLFVGCSSSTDEKAIRSIKKFVNILNKAKISFAILGTKENCCGDPARRMGNEYLYEALVEKNISQFNKYDIKNVLTTCPHCYNQLKNEYKDFDISLNVRHHADFLLELIKNNNISIDKNVGKMNKITTTFHDPCYMGRYNKDYTSSRSILKNLSISITEMYLNKEKSFCCGAGGGKMFMDEHPLNRINKERINQAKVINAKSIVTSCPFCKTMLSDAAADENIEIYDIVDVIDKSIK